MVWIIINLFDKRTKETVRQTNPAHTFFITKQDFFSRLQTVFISKQDNRKATTMLAESICSKNEGMEMCECVCDGRNSSLFLGFYWRKKRRR